MDENMVCAARRTFAREVLDLTKQWWLSVIGREVPGPVRDGLKDLN